ncbi:hypothetical protein DB346_05865 [Verrucomicrobia bacterium LW23]|nr:hypothetical protein DB346_05865 [Verrucomicrobia bacterium LW23]
MTHLFALAAGVAVGANWQAIKKGATPVLAKTGEVIGDVYAVIGQVIAEQKETIEDAIAEKKARSRAKRADDAAELFGTATANGKAAKPKAKAKSRKKEASVATKSAE